MARAAYKSDKDLEGVFSVKDPEGNTMQLWDRGKTFHDKQTGMDAVVFERVVDGKTQVMEELKSDKQELKSAIDLFKALDQSYDYMGPKY